MHTHRYPRAFPQRAGLQTVNPPPAPIIVEPEPFELLHRLEHVKGALLSDERYALPPAGGGEADAEVRRLRDVLHYVYSGMFAEGTPLVARDIEQEIVMQLQRSSTYMAARALADGLIGAPCAPRDAAFGADGRRRAGRSAI